ncbi:hypothetical protein Dvina_19520 [Dactylosporangium vinaceum]|uniref:Uncharacterized protein n=1 Tax=Dactylosporangium vinaceum TaxID=53362 RepID=A0ABV5M9J8_9ACTN|nr:hypothetical protein [Dactylosporangium vinaceum]UAC00051.1 hypothetical protein Dvina_19520 [Dactylosporangium vinaceum]
MRGRGIVLVVLGAVAAVAVLCSLGSARMVALKLRSAYPVTVVEEGQRAGTVVVGTRGRYGPVDWILDDAATVTLPEPGDGRAPGGPRTQGCAGDMCYRVPGRALRVEGSTDGGRSWSTVWEVSGREYDRLVGIYPDLDDPAVDLASTSLVVHAVGGGHIVFVANGRDGLLERDVSGAWRRIGSPDSGEGCCWLSPPPRLRGEPGPFDPAPYVAGIVALVVLAAGGVTAARRRRWAALAEVGVLAALVGWLAFLGATMPDVGMFPGILYGAPVVVAAGVGGVLLAAWIARRRVGPRQPG